MEASAWIFMQGLVERQVQEQFDIPVPRYLARDVRRVQMLLREQHANQNMIEVVRVWLWRVLPIFRHLFQW